MHTFDYFIIGIYMVLLTAIGLFFSGRQVSRREYLLANQNVHWVLAGGSIMATLLSTISYLSYPGEMIRYGVAYFSGVLVIPLIVPTINRIIIPKFYELPITSAYEYLEGRFNVKVRTLAAAVFVVKTIIWTGLITYTASFAIAAMLGLNVVLVILAIGTITTFYSSIGGLRTVIWTDNLQLYILLGGALLIPISIWWSTGLGMASWWSVFSQAGQTELEVFSFSPFVRITVFGIALSGFFWNICTYGGDQVAIQRFMSTSSLGAARLSTWIYTGFYIVIMLVLMVCGLALFSFYFEQSNLSLPAFKQTLSVDADALMPRFIAEELPAGLSGLMVAALLAAAMSSLSSAINSVSGVVVTDFVERAKRGAALASSVLLDKCISVATGVLGTAAGAIITFSVEHTDWNLAELTGRLNHIFLGPLAAVFLSGILFRRVGIKAVLTGFAVGTALSIFICFGKELFGLQENVSFVWVPTAPLLAGVGTAAAVGFFTDSTPRRPANFG